MPAIGFVIGYFTNYIAIKMLFHPRKKIFGIQGVIPKRRRALASRIAGIAPEIMPHQLQKLKEIPFLGGRILDKFQEAVEDQINLNGVICRFIDTAGIRRKKNVKYGTEFFGINRAFKSIDRSDVCVLVIDAVDGVTDQDQKLAGRIEEQGRACIIVVNKWDLVEKNSSTIYQVEKELRSKLYFLHWSKMIFISALTGQRVDNIFEHALNAVNQHRRRVTTSVVNEVLKESISWKSPPTKRSGKQGRLYYGTQVKNKPPTFTLFVNDPKLFGITYRRYIEKQIRVNLGFEGTPLILLWRGKQQRALNKEVERENIELIQKD